jgi:putative peptidoglycan lipid II flippase
VVAVSVITALLPRMSRFAADGKIPEMRATLGQGLRLTLAILVPAAVLLCVLGRSIATLVFAHGNVSVEEARYIGTLLGIFSIGLVAFSCYQLMLRAFYAMQDTRTPTLINLWVNGTLIVFDVVAVLVLPDRWEVAGLAGGQAASFLVGLVVVTKVLLPRIHARGGTSVIRTAVRCTFAVVPAGALALVISLLAESAVGKGFVGALVTLVIAGPVLVVTYVAVVRRLHVPEVDQVIAPVLARLGR